jgi:hypothetical protein
MNWTKDATKVLSLASAGLSSLETIGELIKPFLGSGSGVAEEKIVGVLRIIASIVTSLENGLNGKVSVEDVHDSLVVLRTQLATNDHQTQLDIDVKFPKT